MQSNFSTIFQNIDGNKTNFDTFSLELERVAEKFQIIGLAETNITVRVKIAVPGPLREEVYKNLSARTICNKKRG